MLHIRHGVRCIVILCRIIVSKGLLFHRLAGGIVHHIGILGKRTAGLLVICKMILTGKNSELSSGVIFKKIDCDNLVAFSLILRVVDILRYREAFRCDFLMGIFPNGDLIVSRFQNISAALYLDALRIIGGKVFFVNGKGQFLRLTGIK